MMDNDRMRLGPHRDAFMVRPLGVLVAVMLLGFTVLPAAATYCLADEESCACCVASVEPGKGCCSGEPAPVQEASTKGEASCCITVDVSPDPMLSAASYHAPAPLSVVASLLPADVFMVGRLLPSATSAVRPPAPVPLHIQFCCPRA